jgi:site-specific DNA-methyltransferase (adenine-specific)
MHYQTGGGVIALFCKQPFTSAVVQSNLPWWRYELIWEKDKGTDFGNANRKPLNAHENIEIFYNAQPTYNKQMLKGKPYVKKNYRNNDEDDLNFKSDNSGIWVNNGERTPTSVIKIARDNIHKGTNLHPTQKPVALLEWLIKSYTNEGDTVLDNCMGSGSTGVACINTNRNFIGYELDEEYFKVAERRINEQISRHSKK